MVGWCSGKHVNIEPLEAGGCSAAAWRDRMTSLLEMAARFLFTTLLHSLHSGMNLWMTLHDGAENMVAKAGE